jgi:hypothetical protein
MRTRLHRFAAAAIVVAAIVVTAHAADAKPDHPDHPIKGGPHFVSTNTIDSGGRSFG